MVQHFFCLRRVSEDISRKIPRWLAIGCVGTRPCERLLGRCLGSSAGHGDGNGGEGEGLGSYATRSIAKPHGIFPRPVPCHNAVTQDSPAVSGEVRGSSHH